MHIYQSKFGKLPGTSYKEVLKAARREYHAIQKLSPRRQAYVRSQYFKKDKIFIDLFWDHLKQKHPSDQLRRIALYSAALDLIRHSKDQPTLRPNPNIKDETLYRFIGRTKAGEIFVVQIKEKQRTGRKDFMSVFPFELSKK